MSMASMFCRADIVVLDLILFIAGSYCDVGIAVIPISINMSGLTGFRTKTLAPRRSPLD